MASKKPKKASNNKTAATGAAVRMFCQGLGDCFLVSVPQEGGRDYHILIDCGVAMGTDGAQEKMVDVVRQISKITGGVIDLLVITHEHWDHVSGFTQAQEIFRDQMTVRHLWMAWTEDPKDGLALELKAKYGKAKAAVFKALAALKGRQDQPEMARMCPAMEGLLAFFGPGTLLGAAAFPADGNAAGKKTGGNSLDGAMEIAKGLVGTDTAARSFLLPGETRALPNAAKETTAAGIRVRVLGPPHDGPRVRKLNSPVETYDRQHLHFGGVSWAWTGALAEDPSGSTALEADAAMPFERAWRLPLDQAREHSFFRSHYFGSAENCKPEEAAGFALRRIDGDWLARGAQQLSLWLDSYTNNVSLVLAFELPKSGRILLFVGDAQAGNWLSWHDITTFRDSAGNPLSIKDLFERTVLYKVGHHGSHNATMRRKGLEMMTHPDLVAMLPVDAERATKLGYGEMPLISLQAAINERTGGRLLRLDKPWPGGQLPGEWPSNLSKAELITTPGHFVPYMEYVVHDK